MNQAFISSDECSSSLLRLDLKITQVTWSSSWTVERKLDAIHVSASSGRWAVGYSGHLGLRLVSTGQSADPNSGSVVCSVAQSLLCIGNRLLLIGTVPGYIYLFM